jgi:hypothetical protein
MKQHTKSLAAAVIGLALAPLAQAQEFDFSTISAGQVGTYGNWGSVNVDSGNANAYQNGLEVVSAGYGGGYVDISDYQGAIFINPSDTQYSLTLTVTGPESDYPWQGTGFLLNDSLASTGTFMPNSSSGNDYSGPGNGGNPAGFTWVENSSTSYTLTETGSFDAGDLTTIEASGGYVYGLNLNFDGSPDPGAYDVTFNNLSFAPGPAPEPATLALGGLSMLSLLAFRRRK